uniref:Uncharacterized protein n=1 Tax=Chromera velia CCMP2878 TaxID=1169474 RepID=A0A0G4GMK8_9ALVE|eukprot:Cvel_4926.t1-p1 / transcript=Cvel_4926.t1 / gene=Cvel_4926 / organism=Chromera_velia_CCMP2878 / gene_product=hypothetical protein / transcript_product=hypothetical protein / location=Cvel_scaffold222:87098-87415(+) / protein_length=106 / sequence_SO=supercontig / SO=protein_coding / is_pseudo=false
MGQVRAGPVQGGSIPAGYRILDMLFPDAHTADSEGGVDGSDGERSPRERPEELPHSIRLINMEWQKMEERLKQPEEGPLTEASKQKRHTDTNCWDNPILAATEGKA